MGYIFLGALRTDKHYKRADRYITSELNKIKDLKLKYNEIHKVYDVEFTERSLIYYLDKLEGRGDWIRGLLIFISLLTLMQFVIMIYAAFDQKYLNSNQAKLLVMSFTVFVSSTTYLIWEYKKFQRNKYEALKLFLMVDHHNHKKIIEEEEAKWNPKVKYTKGSPLDFLFGEDN